MGSFNREFTTEVVDDGECSVLSPKLSAINNEVRFSILEILRDYQKVHVAKGKELLYSREINLLLNNYNINITPQMLGQHLKILVEAGLLDEVIVKKEVPNKVGRRSVKAYFLKENAFEDLFLDINFFSDELLTFFELYDFNRKFNDDGYCTLTVFNGVDKGKTFKVNKEDCVSIGRRGRSSQEEYDHRCIILDNEYDTVSKASKPHLRLFFDDDKWYIMDESSTNGTFMGDKEVVIGEKTELKNNSFIKLSKGKGGAVFYCSF